MRGVLVRLLGCTILLAGCGFGDNRELVVAPSCGDGQVDPSEACDDGNVVAGDGCSPACALEVGTGCGDGQVDPGEACDDGNVVAGDGCSASCQVEVVAMCGLVPQAGCDPDQACDLASDPSAAQQGGTECRPLGAGVEVDTCVDQVDCAAGYTCVDTGAASACQRLCHGDPDCDGPGSACIVTLAAAGVDVPGILACTQACDPLSAAGCPAGWACDPGVTSDGEDVTMCHPSGRGVQGDRCRDDAGCATGFACTGGACALTCVVDDQAGCDLESGTTCVPYRTPIVIAGVEFGVCN